MYCSFLLFKISSIFTFQLEHFILLYSNNIFLVYTEIFDITLLYVNTSSLVSICSRSSREKLINEQDLTFCYFILETITTAENELNVSRGCSRSSLYNFFNQLAAMPHPDFPGMDYCSNLVRYHIYHRLEPTLLEVLDLIETETLS